MDTYGCKAGAVDRFSRACAAVVERLPSPLNRVLPPSLLGFALINGCTFGVDLTLLTVLHGGCGLPIAAAVSISYVCAFGLSFVLNRTMNFRSHAPVAGQVVRYVLVVVCNYLVFILGVSSGLPRLGVDYRIARLIAGVCEAGFMYCAMRWIVFPSSAEIGEELPDHVGRVELVADRADHGLR